ncbi:MAG: FecR domain-containing protein [Bacteroidota bacterium]
MIEKDAQKLLEKYRAGTLSTEERALLESWYIDYYKNSAKPVLSNVELQNDLDDIYRSFPLHEKLEPRLLGKPMARLLLYAASVLVFLVAGIFFLKNKRNQNLSAAHQKEIKPANGSAVLILANNKKIILDNNTAGNVAQEGDITVKKTSEGLLTYQVNDKDMPNDAPVEFNTISIPQGREYQVVLSDGTKVWLNAMSSIRFPTAFKGSLREVEITGEAYFEVAKNAKMPFRVICNSQTVQVLGTHFNINAYPEERTVETTLLEGSVRVSLADGQFKILKPGQQSSILKQNNLLTVQDCDTDEAVAWKDGYFQFKDTNLKSIMNALSRWYNVEIVYQNINPELTFGGNISRSKNLSQVLRILELTGNVQFKVEGRRVTVMP